MNRLSAIQLDALAESGNISMGSAATALSLLLGHKVEITTPRLSYATVAEIRELYPIPCVLVRVRYSKGLAGSNIFILSERDAGVIANMMMGDPEKALPDKLDEMYLSAVSEAMNQMMGSSATALSEMFGRAIDITPPDVEYVNLSSADSEVEGLANDTEVILVSFDLAVGDYIASTMLQLLPFDFAEKMVAELLGSLEVDSVEETVPVFISPEEADTISEIGNISMGAAATALATLLDKRVNITTPRVTLTTMRQVKEQFPIPCVTVNVEYLQGLSGGNALIIRERDAALIAAAMMGQDDVPQETLDEIMLSAISEAMNQMMGSSATALSELFFRTVDISPPEAECCDLSAEGAIDIVGRDEPLVQVSFRMEVDGLIDSEMIQLIPLDFAREMIKELLDTFGGTSPGDNESGIGFTEPDVEPVIPEPEMLEVLTDVPQPVWEAEQPPKAEGTVPLELLRDIPVSVTGLLGRRTISIKELMNIAAGSVVELDCPADEPIEILANGKLVGRGEVVLHNDRFGIKITEMIQPW